MKNDITSKERILGALEYKDIDYIPCSFMLFFNLYEKCKNQREFIEEELKLGLDAVVNVGKLSHSLHKDIKYNEWVEEKDGNKYFCRKFETPKGLLTQKVIQRNGWPIEGDFPIFADRIVPRAKEVLVKPEEDLEKLKYLLGSFRKEDIEYLKEESKVAEKIAKKHNLLQAAGLIGMGNIGMAKGYVGESTYQIVGADVMAWLSGYESIMTLSLLKPEIIKEYAKDIHDWTMKQIEIYLDVTDVDLIVRRAWYETTEFWTPEAYKNIIAPTIKKEADLVHQAGKKYGYIITSAFLPIIDYILDSDVDVLIGLDPEEGKGTDMAIVKEKFYKKKKALWGGVSGAITVETGTEEETEKAVVEALKLLSKGGGFILSPVDNISENTENAWNNTYKFINTWKRYRNKIS